MEQSEIEFLNVRPKGRGELYAEYSGAISVCTFRAWLKDLENRGLIRKRKNVLTPAEVITVYREIGKPGLYKASEIVPD